MNNVPKYKLYFAIFDLVVLSFAFTISAFFVRYDKSLEFIDFLSIAYPILILFFIAAAFFIFIFQVNNLYKINVIFNRAAHLTAVIKSLYYGTLNVVVISHLVKSSEVLDSRLIIFMFVIIVMPILYLFRVEAGRRILLQYKQQFNSNVVIVGDGTTGKLLATKLLFENPEGINILGFVVNHKVNEKQLNGIEVLGSVENISEISRQFRIDEIIIAIDDINYERLLEILDICNSLRVTVKLTSELFDIVTKKVTTEKYAGIPVLSASPHYNNNITLKLKRLVDILLSVLGLILLSPILLTISVLVKLSSEGPVFFKQTRIGKDGNAFKFYKFRSMTVDENGEEERKKQMISFIRNNDINSNDTKIVNSNRVTWIGKIIRKLSLDELPQLINVIKGDMSLVGPRPSLPYEFDNYDTWQKRRVNVLPGCTGVWQVWGRSSVSFKDSVVLDLYYINNMSPWLDIQLILKTIPVMLFSRGGK
ncbi:MAG: exopolysaccharide biosynthesis polyprenyl glycosylphosphotransferase [Ignavibacteriae bacterium]|nr:exopolysaccharide biosynthesis polyprenyl glycosylphosphotransferase [Ignavibacteriota bacterium]MCB9207966.1 exopolysaccharide biosynthesis polyprenyl glycosylphosphotransferase [Ignavibacteriales bacterium]MCB9258735.1 exopolysaccharide biosynthesis polyprenyl glycosylphosphotransferase [Ignavibacteriales bacterium]